MVSVLAAAGAVVAAAALVLHDVRRASAPADAAPAAEPADRLLASIAEVEADQRPPATRRVASALALFAFTLLVAGAVAAGIYRMVHAFG